MKKILLIFSYLIVSACQTKPSEEVENSGNENPYELSEAQQKRANIQMGKLEYRQFEHTRILSGRLSVPPNNRAAVSAVLGGYIEQIRVTKGDYVEKGQVLAEIRNPEFIRIQESYAKAKAELHYLESELARQESLFSADINTKKQLERTRADYQTQKSMVESNAQMLRLAGFQPEKVLKGEIHDRTELKAPIHGIISGIQAMVGKFSGATDVLFEIINNHHLHVELDAFENQTQDLKAGKEIKIIPVNHEIAPFKAKIYGFPYSLNEQSRSVKVYAEILNQNSETFFAGMGVRAELNSQVQTSACLPSSAVVYQGAKAFVFERLPVEGKSWKFKRVEVHPVQEKNGYIELTDSLQGDIVIRGAYFIEGQANKSED